MIDSPHGFFIFFISFVLQKEAGSPDKVKVRKKKRQ